MAQSTTVDCCASGSKSLKQSRNWKSRGLTPSSGKPGGRRAGGRRRRPGPLEARAVSRGLPALRWPAAEDQKSKVSRPATPSSARPGEGARLEQVLPQFGPWLRRAGRGAPGYGGIPSGGFAAAQFSVTGRADVGGLEGGGGRPRRRGLGFSSIMRNSPLPCVSPGLEARRSGPFRAQSRNSIEEKPCNAPDTAVGAPTGPGRARGEQLPPKACNLGVRQIDQTFRGLTDSQGDHLRSKYKRGSRHGARPSKGKSYQAGSGH